MEFWFLSTKAEGVRAMFTRKIQILKFFDMSFFSKKILKQMVKVARAKEPDIVAFLETIFKEKRAEQKIPDNELLIGAVLILPNKQNEKKVFLSIFSVHPETEKAAMVGAPMPFDTLMEDMMNFVNNTDEKDFGK
jgi:hypothetical protein